VLAGVGQREAREGLRAFLVARGGVAGADLVFVAAVLQAEGDVSGVAQPMSNSRLMSRLLVHWLATNLPA
jgi:hypothetical protein